MVRAALGAGLPRPAWAHQPLAPLAAATRVWASALQPAALGGTYAAGQSRGPLSQRHRQRWRRPRRASRRSYRLGTSRGPSLASRRHRYGHLHSAEKPPCATNRRKVIAYVAQNMFARVTSQGRACDALQSPYATRACPRSTSVGKIIRWKNRHRGTPRRSLEVTTSLTLRPSTRPTRQDCPSHRARCPHPRPQRGRSPLLRKWPSGSSSLTACSSSPVAPAAPLLLQWPSGSSSPTSRQYGVPPR